jgi:predicted CoA-binding protein
MATKTLEGEIFHEIENLGNKYAHIGFRDKENKFGDMLAEIVPEIGMKKKAKITIELIEEKKDVRLDEKRLISDFLNKKNVFAVVGASVNVAKYGNKIYSNLKSADYEVYPINPKIHKIFEDKCYAKLKDLPKKPDVVSLVVPPKITDRVIKECKDLKINKIWMQPGSESKKINRLL